MGSATLVFDNIFGFSTFDTLEMSFLERRAAKRQPEENNCKTEEQKTHKPSKPSQLLVYEGIGHLITERTVIEQGR